MGKVPSRLIRRWIK